MSEVEVYAPFGIVHCSVCVPKDMSKEDIELEVNRINPTGISSEWKISDNTHFNTGETNPCICNQNPEKMHYLMNC